MRPGLTPVPAGVGPPNKSKHVKLIPARVAGEFVPTFAPPGGGWGGIKVAAIPATNPRRSTRTRARVLVSNPGRPGGVGAASRGLVDIAGANGP